MTMAIDDVLWTGSYKEEGFPPWPCPHCGRHALSIQPGSFAFAGPDWSERFVCLIKCGYKVCGETCSVAGALDYDYEQTGPSDQDYELVSFLKPDFVRPAPAIFAIPRKCPKETKTELEAAFSLFWNDPNAALNRVRIGIECWLDAAGIQRKKRSNKGELYRLSLHERILTFLPAGEQTREMLLALKWLGNIGSHQRTVTRGHLLVAFKLLEAVFDVVIERRPQELGRLAREINRRKGKLK